MSIFRLALGLAAAGAAAVMYSNRRNGGSSSSTRFQTDDAALGVSDIGSSMGSSMNVGSIGGIGSMPGSDRYDRDSDLAGSTGLMDGIDKPSTGLDPIGSGSTNDDLLSPGSGAGSGTPGRSGGM